MKKLVLVALMATSAFAFNGKGMVELNDCFDGTCNTFDLEVSTSTDENSTGAPETETTNVALNYNYLFTNNFGAGLAYVMNEKKTDGDIATASEANSNFIGLNFFWNFDGGWESTYAAVRYNMRTVEDDDDTATTADQGYKQNDIVLELGKRMEMGKAFGMALLYAPAVSYTMGTTDYEDSRDEDDQSTLTLLPVNFAFTF